MPDLKDTLRALLPPVMWTAGKAVGRSLAPGGNKPEWQYVPEGWDYARTHPEVKGWNVEGVLATYQEKWPLFLEQTSGSQPMGVVHEGALKTRTDLASHNITLTFGYVLALAAHGRGKVKMLDWGGGIGHYLHLARCLHPALELEYHCKDVELLARHGATLFPEAHFHADEGCLDDRYDLVMASGSLQYTQDWRALVRRLAAASRGHVFLTLMPVVDEEPSFVVLQRPYAYGYATEYLGWCFNRGELLEEAAAAGLRLVREMEAGTQPVIAGAPEQNRYRGFLFQSPALSA